MSQAASTDLTKPSFAAAIAISRNAVIAAAHAAGRFDAPAAEDKAAGRKVLLELLWQVDFWQGGFRGLDDVGLEDTVARMFRGQVTMAEVTDALWAACKPWPSAEQVAA